MVISLQYETVVLRMQTIQYDNHTITDYWDASALFVIHRALKVLFGGLNARGIIIIHQSTIILLLILRKNKESTVTYFTILLKWSTNYYALFNIFDEVSLLCGRSRVLFWREIFSFSFLLHYFWTRMHKLS